MSSNNKTFQTWGSYELNLDHSELEPLLGPTLTSFDGFS